MFKFLESIEDAGHSPALSPETRRQAGVVPDKSRDATADPHALGKRQMKENGASFPTPNPAGERTGFGVKSVHVIQLRDVRGRSQEVALEAKYWKGVEVRTHPFPRPRQRPIWADEDPRAYGPETVKPKRGPQAFAFGAVLMELEVKKKPRAIP